MKILTYLINLDRSTERLNNAKKQLDAINWTYERFPAYDGRGKALTDFTNYNDKAARDNLGRSLLNSEIGCYMSHYNCVVDFLDSDADYLVVLEDDINLLDDFKEVTISLLTYLYQNDSLDWYLLNIATHKKKFSKSITKINAHSLCRAYYFPILGLGLIWSRQGAKEFASKGKQISMPVDVFFQKWLSDNGNGLTVWPRLVEPSDMESDIWSEATQRSIKRIDLENRSNSYRLKKQARIWRNKLAATKNMLMHK